MNLKIEKLQGFANQLTRTYTESEASGIIFDIRKMSSVEIDPPLQEIIDAGLVPILINMAWNR